MIRSPQDQDVESEPAAELVDRLEALRHRMTVLQDALTAAPLAVASAAGGVCSHSLRPRQLPTGNHSGRPASGPTVTSLVASRGLEILTGPDTQQLLDAASDGFLVTTRLARLHAVGDMLRDLTHELNQPLAAIVNYARGCELRLRAGEFVSTDLADVLGRIAECALGMAAQLRRVNELAQEGAGERVATDLNAIVEEVAAFADAHACKHGCKLHVVLAPQVPRVSGDRVKLGQVVLGALRTCIALGKVPRLHEIWLRTACHDGIVEVVVSHSVADAADGVKELPATALPYDLQLELVRARVIAAEHGALLETHMIGDAGARFRLALPVREEAGS